MDNIKLLICYHKPSPLLKDEILTPIHVGRANAKKRMDHDSENYKWLMDNLIGDDTGENISDKNDYYNEMTAIYWAWKNYDKLGNPDYIGLMHYRRHFVLNENSLDVFNVRNFNEDTYFDEINYSEEKMQKLVEGCDFLPHIGKVINVYKHYTENQRKEDLDLANEIIIEKYPEYRSTMEKYYAGDYSNFCNMCIFNRKLFFQYCEWIFSILEEFENRVDMSEKRFFISERLTGIFVAKLMEDSKLKYKVLPIAFVDEPTEIPVVLNVEKDDYLHTAISMTSILINSDNYNSYHFYLISTSEVSEKVREKFLYFELKYKKCKLEFIESEVPEEFLPLYIPDLLPKVNKCIYLSGDTIALKDIGEFYRICSVDDYLVVGIPQIKYDTAEKNKKIRQELLVINCKRMRKHQLTKGLDIRQCEEENGINIFNELCKGEIGYIPWYLFTSENLTLHSKQLFYADKRRSDIQAEALWRPFLVYDLTNPLENNQGIYSIFWWDMIKEVPLYFQKFKVNLYILGLMYTEQQKEINSVKEGKYISDISLEEPVKKEFTEESEAVQGESQIEKHDFIITEEKGASKPPIQEEWRTYNLWGKFVFFYKNNGGKKTLIYGWKKIFGGNR